MGGKYHNQPGFLEALFAKFLTSPPALAPPCWIDNTVLSPAGAYRHAFFAFFILLFTGIQG